MLSLVSYLKNLKLSLSSWAIITLSTIVGSLVVALKLQGSRLHAAQVALLAAHLNNQMEKDDADVATARDKYVQALNDYRKTKP